MSYEYRNRLKELGYSKLKCEQEEWEFIWEHIADFCIASDIKVKEKFGETANEEEIICKMSEPEFIEFALETIKETLVKLGYNKKGRKKKAKITDVELEEDFNLLLQEQKMPPTQQTIDEKISCGCEHI